MSEVHWLCALTLGNMRGKYSDEVICNTQSSFDQKPLGNAAVAV